MASKSLAWRTSSSVGMGRSLLRHRLIVLDLPQGGGGGWVPSIE